MRIELKRDSKAKDSWILTKEDAEGFHHQINLTKEELLRINQIIMSDVW